MANKLHFSLVSPARELFSGEVDHVIAPGSEGEFGVLANHAPFMTTLKNGVVRVLEGNDVKMRIFVRGGFADVTPEGLTILAEEARMLDKLKVEDVQKELEETHLKIQSLDKEDSTRLTLQEHYDYSGKPQGCDGQLTGFLPYRIKNAAPFGAAFFIDLSFSDAAHYRPHSFDRKSSIAFRLCRCCSGVQGKLCGMSGMLTYFATV